MSYSQRYGLLRSLLIYYGNPWRKRRMKTFYARFIRPGDLYFDIGAHVGNRTAVWVALGAKVVALEPQPYLMGFLRRQFHGQERVTLVEQAVGAAEGTAVLHLSERNPTVATLSPTWMSAVRQDNAFSGLQWDKEVRVAVTTLDALVARYGRPAFCKIDVEGYESAVLQGLSIPLPALSFEFVSATAEIAVTCVARLETLGRYRYNWALGEQQQLQREEWVSATVMTAQLLGPLRTSGSGDVYARLVD